MKDKVLDFPEDEIQEQVPSGILIGIGVFLYLVIISFAHLIDSLLTDISLFIHIPYELIFWIKEIAILSIIFLSIIFTISKYKFKEIQNERKARKYLKTLILIMIIAQLSQFLYAFFRYDIWPKDFLNNLGLYYDALNKNSLISLSRALFEYIKYAIIGIPLIRK